MSDDAPSPMPVPAALRIALRELNARRQSIQRRRLYREERWRITLAELALAIVALEALLETFDLPG